MSPNQWQQINALASTALGYEGEARTQFLDQTCSDNPALRAGVETLVTYCEQGNLQKQDRATLLEPAPSTVIQPSTQIPIPSAAATVQMPDQDAATTVHVPIQDAASTVHNPTPEAAATILQEAAATNLEDSPTGMKSKISRFSSGEMLGDRYRITGLLGRGGMGEVYRADDTKLGQPVALKFLNESFANDGAMLARFHGEVRAARQVTHPNVCRVHDIGEVSTAGGRLHFLSMEYVDGEDLASLLRRIGRFPEDRALEVARQICTGLAAAHDAGILHRDLKPANVMVDSRGRIRLTDFGLAGLMGEFRGRDVMSGTPAYMSPEQLAGKEVTIKSDIYALGLVLYEIFTGQKAFSAGTLAELKRMHESTAPTTPSSLVKEIDRRVESVILDCLEKSPSNRPSSAIQVVAGLPGGDPLAAAVAAGETPSPEMIAAASRVGSLTQAKAGIALASVVVGLIVLLFLSSQASFHSKAHLEKSPDVLADRAGTLVKKLGYTESVIDRERGFGINQDYQDYLLRRDPSPDKWDKAAVGEPPLFYFWYRQSPRYLEPLMKDFVTLNDPPLLLSGMVNVVLNPQGKLIEFQAEPPQIEIQSSNESTPLPTPDWKGLFDAAELDLASFKPVEPQWRPPVYSDARAAWEGKLPAPTEYPVRIEAAAYHGKPTYFEIIGAWSQPVRTGSPPASLRGRLSLALLSVGFIALVIAGVMMTRHNLRRGRADRRGAFKLALFVFAANSLAWLFDSSHVPSLSGETTLLSRAIPAAFFSAAVFWLYYIAMESYIRRRQPERIISWSRLLAGGWRDPLVGRDVLIGAACGIWLIPLSLICKLVEAKVGPPAIPALISPASLLGLPGLIPQFVNSWLASIFNGLGLLLILLLVTALFRHRERVAAALLWLILTAVWGLSSGTSPVELVYFALATGTLIFLLIRFGLLVFIIADFYLMHSTRYPLTLDFSVWYAPYSHFAVLTALAIAIYGFYISLAGQPLFRRGIILDPDHQ